MTHEAVTIWTAQLSDPEIRLLAAGLITEYAMRFGVEQFDQWAHNMLLDEEWRQLIETAVFERAVGGLRNT